MVTRLVPRSARAWNPAQCRLRILKRGEIGIESVIDVGTGPKPDPVSVQLSAGRPTLRLRSDRYRIQEERLESESKPRLDSKLETKQESVQPTKAELQSRTGQDNDRD
ncbi:hypothetical protein EVAR_18725_1 [Eumeta japonica]|uniref:Uncharacterized protein n=1 Tax=Eumeta variegata TaxID=151549 RepID=A0A4C1UNI3_EUMVA|nr:hypothetical protein EVAR_18725_1 [Eumeta japonica]